MGSQMAQMKYLGWIDNGYEIGNWRNGVSADGHGMELKGRCEEKEGEGVKVKSTAQGYQHYPSMVSYIISTEVRIYSCVFGVHTARGTKCWLNASKWESVGLIMCVIDAPGDAQNCYRDLVHHLVLSMCYYGA